MCMIVAGNQNKTLIINYYNVAEHQVATMRNGTRRRKREALPSWSECERGLVNGN
jgi:hypothetical protein